MNAKYEFMLSVCLSVYAICVHCWEQKQNVWVSTSRHPSAFCTCPEQIVISLITHSLAVALETLVGFWPHQPASSIVFCCSLN